MHLILLAFCLTCLPLSAYSWGFFAHQRINRLAVFSLPPEMIAFYKANIEYITAHATDADKRRYIIAEEGPRHYIDIDHYGRPPFAELPRSWQEAIGCYSADTLNTYGILPWYLEQMMHRLTNAFREGDAATILKLSADIGHYAGDAHVPLHACSNHNGQLTGQHGIHGLWESRIPELMADKTFSYLAGKAVYIKDVRTYTWHIVLESAVAADTVLQQEKIVSNGFPSGRKFAYEKRNGKLVRNYSTAYARAYHIALGNMVERRMIAAIHATANYWYTAWANAGMPALEKLLKGYIIQDTFPAAKDRMIGRQEG
ncbi:zinc dependent phospholipase C family protein [Chitinophaga rhizophila]|uniref:S1/P1 Nuclease n=1 Tax=Chitinophaga rhizophila TaxID=2866212 RepID=A0ABS7GGW3_9BACT|nr:zinc dependent phospholipase C family protein [Chitinophaga rhizophila]MBW8686490.1 S1/P1 Nuclease [Chitinophaga rhizophila]